MEVRKGYKQTEVGVIPEDWEIKKIKDVAPLQRGFDLPNQYLVAGDYPVVYSNGIQNRHNKFQVKAPGIVTGRSGTIGKVTFIEEDYWPHNTSLWVTDFKNNNPKFIFYLFQRTKLERFAIGSGVPTLNRNDVHDFQVALPTKSEQTAIATTLSDADELISSMEKLIAKKRAIKQGAMQELLRPKEGWEVKKLGEIGDIKMCRRIFNYETKTEGTIPFYKIGTFGKDPDAYISQDLYNSYRQRFSFPKKGDILISAAGTIGRTVVYDGSPAYFQDSNIVWIENDESLISNTFLFYIFQIVNYTTEGGTIQRLYNAILRNTEFNCPPKVEQTNISTILSDMDAEIAGLEHKLSKYKQVKQGMMQELLTGKIRLK